MPHTPAPARVVGKVSVGAGTLGIDSPDGSPEGPECNRAGATHSGRTYTITLSERQMAVYAEARRFFLVMASGRFFPLPGVLAARVARADQTALLDAFDSAAFTPKPLRQPLVLPAPEDLATTRLTWAQLHDLGEAVDTLGRWCGGQCEACPGILMAQGFYLRDERLLRFNRILFPDYAGSSRGVGWSDNPEQQTIQIAYEIWKAVFHQLMKDRRAQVLAEGNTWYGTTHDDPFILMYSGEPRAQITVQD